MPTSRTHRRLPGWLTWLLLVGSGGVLSVVTAPGQTAGLSVFTDPLLVQLDTTRTALSASYLVGTLVGAAAQPFIGRGLDRFGAPRTLAVIVVAFAAVLVGLSVVGSVAGLTLGYVGVRMLGQGALGLAATTAVARAVTHRRGLALGVTGALGSAGISLAPVGLERLVTAVGMGPAWRWEAFAVVSVGLLATGVLTLALRHGQRPSNRSEAAAGPRPGAAPRSPAEPVWTLALAVRTSAFWVIAASLATSGMLSTALAFHQIALLGERGLSPLEASANFLPQTVTGLLATLATGALVDRVSPRWFVAVSMGSLAVALALVGLVTPGISAISYGLVLGVAGGALRGMEAATYVAYYGVRHIGTIRGVATSIGLASTALGPLLLSLGRDWAGGFAAPSLVLAVVPVAVGVAGLMMRAPVRPDRRTG
ncbi:MFS transporter [Auraticoccus monumenti]|uniref:Cyanate permease n=1 Tax=Auraticoccus monumenti TaxID=675864 RepID=A0A1G6VPQ6_9ACTN|nr:MFS transporter [Auraticoccus monumenti]SDD55514.1 Cyanate permease [Auraticoccus monumenti]